MIRLLAILWCVGLGFPGKAQDPYFMQHEMSEGDEGSPIHAIFQDHQCMIWLGTENGLVQYDGTVWQDHPIIPDGTAISVTALFEDQSHHIWIGTSSGRIFILDPSRTSREFLPDEGHPTKPITAIGQDPQGFIWMASYGEGAYVYSGSRLYHLGMDDGLRSDDIYAMTITPHGEVWLGTDDGINICTFTNERKYIRALGLADGLPDQIVTALKSDEAGNIWIGTFEKGVVRFDVTLQKIVVPFQPQIHDEITSFTLFDQDEIWIGTRANGAWRYEHNRPFPRKILNPVALRQEKVRDMLTDVEGNIWIVTSRGTVFSAVRPFETLVANVPDIQALYCDHQDRVWIGTRLGLFRVEEFPEDISRTVREATHYDFNIASLIEDRFHNLWIGTIDQGLYVYHPASGKVRHIGSIIRKGGLSVMSMDTSTAEIWLATLEGVVSYPSFLNIMYDPDPAFGLLEDPWPSNLHFIFQVYVDSGDRVWFATDGNGLFCMEGGQIRQYTGQDEVRIRTVYSLCEDQRGHIWLNTPDHGLIEFDGSTFTPLGVKDGLGHPQSAAFLASGTGDFLIAHGRGVDLLEPGRKHFMYYRAEIGLRYFEPALNAIARNSRGHVYVGGRSTLVRYLAPKERLSIHPKTLITRVRVYDQEIDFYRTDRMPYYRNYISIDYVGLWYTSPTSVKYQYKLEGYDLEWKESRDKTASYSNLRPGAYTFIVKASENNFFLDEPAATYSFTIRKPFWWQAWFVGLVGCVSAGILYWIVKAREHRFQRQTLLKKEMIESQLATLKAQINPHFLFNSFNTLITLIDENAMNPRVAIEYVEKLADFYRSILQYREQELISLSEEWSLVQHFVYLLEKRYGSNLRLNADPPPAEGFIMPLVLQILVENAVKHNVISEKYPLVIRISIDPDGYISVMNTIQAKSQPEPSTRFGLQSIIKRYQMLTDRKVMVEQDDLRFIVRIPIIQKSSL